MLPAMRTRHLSPLAVLLLVPALAAWNATGHRTVADIAWAHMTPHARARAVALLLHGPQLAGLQSLRPPEGSDAERDRALFLNAATWADLVRERGTAWHVYSHPSWHYADFFWEDQHGTPHDLPDAGPEPVNAGERITVFRAVLSDPSAADTTKALALAWLLHLVGDVHQPLHTSSRVTPREPLPRGDEGGNTFHLDDSHRLHAFWDDILDESVARQPGEDVIAYATRLAAGIERTYPLGSLAAPAASTDVTGWEHGALRVAQTVVYAGVARGAAPSTAYRHKALQTSERQIALAGYRLAALLNQALE
jgi:S1/P1 Nuclease